MSIIVLQVRSTFTKFVRSEEGLALTEYLMLLGLLTSVVILSITAFGQALGMNWMSWSEFIGSLDPAPLLVASEMSCEAITAELTRLELADLAASDEEESWAIFDETNDFLYGTNEAAIRACGYSF